MKKFDEVEIDHIKSLLTDYGFEYSNVECTNTRKEILFKGFKRNFEFSFTLDRDTASYRHSMSWKTIGDARSFNFQNTRWTAEDDFENIIKCLKRRINKWKKTYKV